MIVEGPVDAIAVTVASAGRYLGVAPLGTALTDPQAAQLAGYGRNAVVATDGDPAGRLAAERDYWKLAVHHVDPLRANLPDGTDPADLLTRHGPQHLTEILTTARPLADLLIQTRLQQTPVERGAREAVRVLASTPPARWDPGSTQISMQSGLPREAVRLALRNLASAWNGNPAAAAQDALQTTPAVEAGRETRASASESPARSERQFEQELAEQATRGRTLQTRSPFRPRTSVRRTAHDGTKPTPGRPGRESSAPTTPTP